MAAVVLNAVQLAAFLTPSPAARATTCCLVPSRAAITPAACASPSLKGYFATKDVLLVARSSDDVAAFHEKERKRWREVYDEEYVEAPQEFYPGDRVEIVGAIAVREMEDARGMHGVVLHFEFDDGYEACQTCSTSCPLTVLLDAGSSAPPAATKRVSEPTMRAGASDRRRVLTTAVAAGGLWHVLDAVPASAADQRPVLVLGASGGTGRECVRYLLAHGRPCIAATRSGEFDAAPSTLLTIAKGDVTSAQSLGTLITPGKLSAVIYAASASRQSEAKKTSNARAVDERGVVECAKLCIASEVPRLVLVSSGGVSKPTSAVYVFLNLAANGIMDAKISGEKQSHLTVHLAPTLH
uniref:NAD(P)-binding domain-containing protein n=1 Tax=Haptolina brevifila TaxID=156173 RepID=A0A7S2NLV3_9EUKA|mmetsp:Transcript_81824/g.162891  ORF Transcript_81824/g.162891 Transcript_81824/m.162891 type:complete len:354 (+) Transcript_81824:47-1108(+)